MSKHEKRYERNGMSVTPDDMTILKNSSVCVIGCGGLGGGVIEGLARTGVGRLTAVDGDTFDLSNLNRQILSDEKNIGHFKADEAAARIRRVNSEVDIRAERIFIDRENIAEILKDHDVAVDALDSQETRLILEEACQNENIPLIHGAICGWSGQAAVVMPGNRMLSKIYDTGCIYSDDNEAGNPYFTAAVISAIQVAETVKVLLDKGGALKNRLITVDLREHEYEITEFGE